MHEKPLVDKEYLLEKLPGKYGWTFTIISEIPPDPSAPFSWVKVRGSIDGYEIKKYHLIPSGKTCHALQRQKVSRQELKDW